MEKKLVKEYGNLSPRVMVHYYHTEVLNFSFFKFGDALPTLIIIIFLNTSMLVGIALTLAENAYKMHP